MFSALFSFLGGSVFRMIWGEVANFVQKKQDHAPVGFQGRCILQPVASQDGLILANVQCEAK